MTSIYDMDRARSLTIKNYKSLKKAGYDMKKHKLAAFLLASDEEDSEEV